MTAGDLTTVLTFSGLIQSAGSFTKVGTGNLVLNGANTLTGTVSANAGTLSLAKTTDTLSTSTKLAVGGSGTVDVLDDNTVGSISGSGIISLDGTSTLTAGADNGNASFTGDITGATGSLEKSGTGILSLSGDNSFATLMNVSAGTLHILDSGSLDNTVPVTVASGALIDIDTSVQVGTIAGAGSYDLASGATLTSGLASTTTTVTGFITGAGAIDKVNTGILVLNWSQRLFRWNDCYCRNFTWNYLRYSRQCR